MVDLHTHILPFVDDGAKDIYMSLSLIDMECRDNVDTVVLTPHYYPFENLFETFITDRFRAYQSLKTSIRSNNIELILGCEVHYSDLLLQFSDLKPLCIENTNYMLLELPSTRKFSSNLIDNIEIIANKFNITPLIAHVELYPAVEINIKILKELKDIGCVFQVDSESIICNSHRVLLKKLFDKNYVDVVASDCHNDKVCLPNLNKGMKCIYDNYGKEITNKIINNSYRILKNEDINREWLVL